MKKGFLLGGAKQAAAKTDKEQTGAETKKEMDQLVKHISDHLDKGNENKIGDIEPSATLPNKEPAAEETDKEQVPAHTWFFIPSGEETVPEPASAQKEKEPVAAETKPAAVQNPKAPLAEQKGKKRRRNTTRSRSHGASPSAHRGFFIPGHNKNDDVSKGMAMNELMDASKGFTNMALAHEIAVDKDFSLKKIEPENTVEQRVQDMMKKAFWDIMEEQLKNDPPQFDQSLEVLRDVKKMIFSILLPQHNKLKKSIDDILDLDLIKQQIEAGALDFKKYAEYILRLMGQLCAPVHDDQIEDLKNTLISCQQQITNIVPLFKGITELLEKMKIDMANFTIQSARPLIMNQSVEYEKIKFKEFLEKQEDGLTTTREWLIRHGDATTQKSQKSGTAILNEAYTEILEWDEYYHLPETLVMDEKRIFGLRNQVDRVAVSTAIMMMCQANFVENPFMLSLRRSSSLKETIKKNIDILLEDFQDDIGLLEILPRVADQVMKDIQDNLDEENKEGIDNAAREASFAGLISGIKHMEDPNQPLRDLYQKKIIALMKEAITACDPQASSKPSGMKVPPTLMICQKEMFDIAGQFVRLVNYNKSVFGEFYNQIVENHIFFKV